MQWLLFKANFAAVGLREVNAPSLEEYGTSVPRKQRVWTKRDPPTKQPMRPPPSTLMMVPFRKRCHKKFGQKVFPFIVTMKGNTILVYVHILLDLKIVMIQKRTATTQ